MQFLRFKQTFSLLLTLLSVSVAFADDSIYWMRLKAQTPEERTVIANQFAIEVVNEKDVVVLGSAAELKAMQQADKVISYYKTSPTAFDFPQEDERFHNYSELTEALTELTQMYPQWARLTSIGKTVENRDIWMITLGAKPDDHTLPGVLFVGGHHAREHISIETPLLLAQELLEARAGGDTQITRLLNTRIVHIIPLLNADGAEYDVSSGRYRMWRKNRKQNSDGSYGVDLNRNYDYKFGTVGASNDPTSEVYHGPRGFSEPETQAVRDFLTATTNITIVQSYHTFSELILYPWGHTYSPISNAKDQQVHQTMA